MPVPLRHRRGRPAKYGRPARAVSITLPEDVLARLGEVDADLGQAIVAVVERRTARPRPRRVPPAEIAQYGRHAVIVVTPTRALTRLPGVELIPIGRGRALISLQDGRSPSQFELDLRDAIDRGGAERATLEAVADILRQSRRSHTVAMLERKVIVLEAKRQR